MLFFVGKIRNIRIEIKFINWIFLILIKRTKNYLKFRPEAKEYVFLNLRK